MSVIDFHSHLLPNMDDGSRSVEMSLQMLAMSADQGVDRIVASSHFYADQDTVDSFLKRREASYEALAALAPAGAPGILLGAEVYYFEGISKSRKISQLCIAGTDVLLLEMPFTAWTRTVLTEVSDLISAAGCRIVIAHLERYRRNPGSRSRIEELLQLPVTVQINAASLLDFRIRRSLIRMFRSGRAGVLGSDCHDLQRRPPNLAKGRSALKNNLGEEALHRMDALGEELFLS